MSHVFREAGKAETKLKNIQKRREERLTEVNAAYDQKRDKYLESVGPHVRNALRLAGVLPFDNQEQLPGIDADEAPAEA